MATAPTTWATVNVDGRLEVFMIGVNDAGDQGLWHIWQTPHGNGWTPWFSHGIPPRSAGLRWSPAVVCPSDGRIELFVVSDDLQPGGLGSGGALYRKRQTAPDNDWANWVPLQAGGPDLFGTPAVTSSSGGGLELFALGADGALWHSRRTDSGAGWSEWFSHGSPAGLLLNSAPAVASSADGHLEVFIVSEDAVMWHILQTAPNGDWSQWFSDGTPSGVSFGSDSTPALASDSNGCLQLFTVGNDGTLWHMRQIAPDGDWSGWWSHDAPSGVKLSGSAPRSLPAPMDAWSCSWSTTTKTYGTCGKKPRTGNGPHGHVVRHPRQRGWWDPRPWLPAPSAAWSSSWRAPTGRCGTSGRRHPTATGRRGARMGRRRSLCC